MCGWLVGNEYIQIYELSPYWPNFWKKKFLDNQRFTYISFYNVSNSLIVNKEFLNIGETA